MPGRWHGTGRQLRLRSSGVDRTVGASERLATRPKRDRARGTAERQRGPRPATPLSAPDRRPEARAPAVPGRNRTSTPILGREVLPSTDRPTCRELRWVLGSPGTCASELGIRIDRMPREKPVRLARLTRVGHPSTTRISPDTRFATFPDALEPCFLSQRTFARR